MITTQRLELRPWTEDDLPLALALWGDPRVTAFIGGPFSEEAIRERLRSEVSSSVQYWPAFLSSDLAHVGCAGLRPYDPARAIFEFGVHLRPQFWGMGLAEEAARAVIECAFDALRANGLFAGHHPRNEASRRLLPKLGFRSIEPQFYAPTGLEHPSYMLDRR